MIESRPKRRVVSVPSSRSTGLALLTAGLALALTVTAADADAAGLWFSDRGVRPMGRAGAFVAGVDDLHGIWFNPAGIADAGDAALVDFAWLRMQNS